MKRTKLFCIAAVLTGVVNVSFAGDYKDMSVEDLQKELAGVQLKLETEQRDFSFSKSYLKQELENFDKECLLKEEQIREDINKENDVIKKQELENKERILKLQNQTKRDLLSYDLEGDFIVYSKEETIKNLEKTAEEKTESFLNVLMFNGTKTGESYKIKADNVSKFPEQKPVKRSYEGPKKFKERLKKYNKDKKKYEKEAKEKAEFYKSSKDDAVKKDEFKSVEAAIGSVQPYVEKIRQVYSEQEQADLDDMLFYKPLLKYADKKDVQKMIIDAKINIVEEEIDRIKEAKKLEEEKKSAEKKLNEQLKKQKTNKKQTAKAANNKNVNNKTINNKTAGNKTTGNKTADKKKSTDKKAVNNNVNKNTSAVQKTAQKASAVKTDVKTDVKTTAKTVK